jgi:hypothetical protein
MRGGFNDWPSSGRINKAFTVLRLCCALILVGLPVAEAQSREASKVEQPISFDIAAQPLAKALYAFSAKTGIEVLVDARQAAGLTSQGVKGTLNPRDALEILLAGSNLVVQEFGPETMTLRSREAPPGSSVTLHQRAEPAFYADIQRAVFQALCHDVRATPGRYRIALRLWVSASGTVLQSKRLDTTGDGAIDAAIDTIVQGLSIGRAPPAGLAQPIALVISPRQGSDAAGCPPNAPDMRRASNR